MKDQCPASDTLPPLDVRSMMCLACGSWVFVNRDGYLPVHAAKRGVNPAWEPFAGDGKRPLRRERHDDISLDEYMANPRLCPCGAIIPYRMRITMDHCSRKCAGRDIALHKRVTSYGITVEQHQALFDSQGGLCAVCRVRPAHAIDHDHVCCPELPACGRCVRGLLCSGCNTSLGFFHDDVELLQAAIDYLNKFTAERRLT